MHARINKGGSIFYHRDARILVEVAFVIMGGRGLDAFTDCGGAWYHL